jgi:hypothetical protein
MELQTIGRPRNPGNPLLDMFTRIIQEGQNLPVPVEMGKPLASRAHQDIASLNLSDSRSIVVDGRPAQLPLGTGKKCTGAAIKALAGVYRGRILFIQEGQHWRRLNDDEVVELADKQSYRTEEAPVFRSAPRLTVD